MPSQGYQDHVASIRAASWPRLIVLPAAVALLVLIVLPSLFTLLFGLLVPPPHDTEIHLAGALGMHVTVLLGGMLMIKASAMTWAGLGFTSQDRLRQCALGLALGAGLLALVALAILALGGITITWAFTPAAIGTISVAALFFLAQGVWEELVYRAYLMPHLSKAWGDTASILVTSVLFTVFHALNPGLGVMPILNLTVFGLVFALLYYRTGSMWITGLAHSAWNFAQGYVFGSEVSGNATHHSVMASRPVQGHELLSGGSFGFEGSIVTTLTGVALIVLLTVLWPRLRWRTADSAHAAP